MKIDGIVVSCYKYDVYFTRVCVASIRFWYPEIPIWLLKDNYYGDFDTAEIERYWGVRVYHPKREVPGWGFAKLALLTELPRRRLLILDSDIVFVGRVLERLEACHADFVVHKQEYDADAIDDEFYATRLLQSLDPSFEAPGWGFNTGQVVATTGLIAMDELDGLVDWSAGCVRHAEVFKKGEQGLTNYVVHRKLQAKEVSLHREPFMLWPGKPTELERVEIANLTAEGGTEHLVHWAGFRWGRELAEMPRSEILLHFEDLYYRPIPMGQFKRRCRSTLRRLERSALAPAKQKLKRAVLKLAPLKGGAPRHAAGAA